MGRVERRERKQARRNFAHGECEGQDNVTGTRASISRFVQICPNDGPPFLDLCQVYANAAGNLGLAATTVFLGPSRVEPAPAGNCYLNAPDLRATGALAGKLRKLLPELSGSLVLCHRYRSYRVFARSGARAARVIALAHEHGFFRRKRRRLSRLLFGRRVLFAGVSPTIVEELERVAGSALHLPNALDLETLQWSDRVAARRELGLPADGVCIGVIGRLHYKKNPALALDSFRLFHERAGPAHLAVVGDGDLRQGLEAHARELRVRAAADAGSARLEARARELPIELPASSSNIRLEAHTGGLPVTFTGFVRDPRRLFRAFDVVLLTTGARAFPNMVALESMAAEVPVVAPRLPDAISILGEQGHYFENADPESVTAALCEAIGLERRPEGLVRVQREFSVAAVTQRLERLLA